MKSTKNVIIVIITLFSYVILPKSLDEFFISEQDKQIVGMITAMQNQVDRAWMLDQKLHQEKLAHHEKTALRQEIVDAQKEFATVLQNYVSKYGKLFSKKSGFINRSFVDCIASVEDVHNPITLNEHALLLQVLQKAMQIHGWGEQVKVSLKHEQHGSKHLNLEHVVKAIQVMPVPAGYSWTAIATGAATAAVLGAATYYALMHGDDVSKMFGFGGQPMPANQENKQQEVITLTDSSKAEQKSDQIGFNQIFLQNQDVKEPLTGNESVSQAQQKAIEKNEVAQVVSNGGKNDEQLVDKKSQITNSADAATIIANHDAFSWENIKAKANQFDDWSKEKYSSWYEKIKPQDNLGVASNENTSKKKYDDYTVDTFWQDLKNDAEWFADKVSQGAKNSWDRVKTGQIFENYNKQMDNMVATGDFAPIGEFETAAKVDQGDKAIVDLIVHPFVDVYQTIKNTPENYPNLDLNRAVKNFLDTRNEYEPDLNEGLTDFRTVNLEGDKAFAEKAMNFAIVGSTAKGLVGQGLKNVTKGRSSKVVSETALQLEREALENVQKRVAEFEKKVVAKDPSNELKIKELQELKDLEKPIIKNIQDFANQELQTIQNQLIKQEKQLEKQTKSYFIDQSSKDLARLELAQVVDVDQTLLFKMKPEFVDKFTEIKALQEKLKDITKKQLLFEDELQTWTIKDHVQRAQLEQELQAMAPQAWKKQLQAHHSQLKKELQHIKWDKASIEDTLNHIYKQYTSYIVPMEDSKLLGRELKIQKPMNMNELLEEIAKREYQLEKANVIKMQKVAQEAGKSFEAMKADIKQAQGTVKKSVKEAGDVVFAEQIARQKAEKDFLDRMSTMQAGMDWITPGNIRNDIDFLKGLRTNRYVNDNEQAIVNNIQKLKRHMQELKNAKINDAKVIKEFFDKNDALYTDAFKQKAKQEVEKYNAFSKEADKALQEGEAYLQRMQQEDRVLGIVHEKQRFERLLDDVQKLELKLKDSDTLPSNKLQKELELKVNRLYNALQYKSSWFDRAKLEGMDAVLKQQAEKVLEEYAVLEKQGQPILAKYKNIIDDNFIEI